MARYLRGPTENANLKASLKVLVSEKFQLMRPDVVYPNED